MQDATHTKRQPLPGGVLFLIASLAVFSPVVSIGSLANNLLEAKRLNPDITQVPAFQTFSAWLWAIVLIESVMGIAIAVMLYRTRARQTLITASILMWARVAIGSILIFFAHSSLNLPLNAGISADIARSFLWLVFWTFYLFLSKKVSAAYVN